MPTNTRNQLKRAARWQRKQRRETERRQADATLKERANRRKTERGVEQVMRHVPQRLRDAARTKAAEQLWEVTHRLKLIKKKHHSRPGYVSPDNPYVVALANFAIQRERWLRDPRGFHTRTHNPYRQFTELTRHLFADYPPPAFMEQAWFVRNPRQAALTQGWYIDLARGQSPRKLGKLPIDLTRAAAHLLPTVPPELTVWQGFRWAQVRAMGATHATATAILASPIGVDFKRDGFWLTVVRFLVDQPMLDPNRIGPIVDYIHHQRHVDQLIGDGERQRHGPAMPNYSMKGRSIQRLLTQVDRWHGRLAAAAPGGRRLNWRPCGIDGMQWTEGNGDNEKKIIVRELLNSTVLANEGASMGHCVASYATSCATRRVAIFTMTRESKKRHEKMLTVEVRPSQRLIVQARGHCNRVASMEERRLLNVWASQVNLKVSSFV